MRKHPTDAAAREKFAGVNETLKQINERYGYPQIWVIDYPKALVPVGSEAGTTSTMVAEASSSGTHSKSWRPGLTRKGEPILRYRTISGDGNGNPRGY